MRLRLRRAVLTALLSLLPAFAVSAQEQNFGPFVYDPAHPDVAVLAGEMTAGTFAGFAELIAAQPRLRTLVLDSPGGLDVDSRRIADLIDALGIDTVVPDNSVCFSACATIFFAGRNRIAIGRLGVHRSSSEVGFIDRGELADLLAFRIESWFHYGVPPEVLLVTYRTPAEDIYVFSEAEMTEWGLNRGSVEAMRGLGAGYLVALADARSAVLYENEFRREEDANHDGRVTWRVTGPADAPLVVADATIADAGLSAEVTFDMDGADRPRTITIAFDTDADFAAGGVASLDNLIVNSGGANAIPVIGEITSPERNVFTFTLIEIWDARNVPLILGRDEFTFLLTYDNGRHAALTLERSAAANETIATAAMEWDGPAADPDPNDRAVFVMPDESGNPTLYDGTIVWLADQRYVRAVALVWFEELDLFGRFTIERNSSANVAHTARMLWSAPRPSFTDRLGGAEAFGARERDGGPILPFPGNSEAEGGFYRFQLSPEADTEQRLRDTAWLELTLELPDNQHGRLSLEVGANGAAVLEEITDRWID